MSCVHDTYLQAHLQKLPVHQSNGKKDDVLIILIIVTYTHLQDKVIALQCSGYLCGQSLKWFIASKYFTAFIPSCLQTVCTISCGWAAFSTCFNGNKECASNHWSVTIYVVFHNTSKTCTLSPWRLIPRDIVVWLFLTSSNVSCEVRDVPYANIHLPRHIFRFYSVHLV